VPDLGTDVEGNEHAPAGDVSSTICAQNRTMDAWTCAPPILGQPIVIGGMERAVLVVESASDGRLRCSQPCAGGVRCGHRSLLGPAAQPPGSRLSLEVP
jgi:hypothetical protein